jgi:uncharacterized protein
MLLSLHDNGPLAIRSCSADAVVLSNGDIRRSSFVLSVDGALQDWAPGDAKALIESDLAPVLAQQPDVFLLGTGPRQVFPSAAVMAACLSRRIGIEVMDNAAAARTFNVLSSEGRKVLLAMLLPT